MPPFKLDLTRKISTTPDKGSLVNFLIQFLVIAVLFFAIGFAVGQKRITYQRQGYIPHITVTGELPPKDQNVDFSLFWKVLEILPQKYVDKGAIDSQKILYGAISGMVKSLGDPYTAFLDPKQNEEIKSEIAGSYEGIGIQIGFDVQKRLAVIAPLSGTPAEREGVLAKDLIIKIDDKDTTDLTLPQAVDLIRGPAGSKVKLILRREAEDEQLEKVIARAKIDVKSVEVKYVDSKGKKVGVIKVSNFGEKTNAEWDRAVEEVLANKVDGVIVDMRNNPGGLLSSSVYITGDFVKGVVVKQQYANGSVQSLTTDGRGRLLKIPMAVLVNGGSASAAEIFSGAIQDARRGQLVGEKTFGKGTVQDVVELSGGGGLHVTIAKWLTPKSHSINGIGISPDVIVELSAQDRKENKDPQLDRVLEAVI
ncbi:hypothetical protein A3A60_00670 [Candidatus Curtissbacteria bacterium RIFCSPLOWO2_01_FULL_42_26]|uniref:PDZ domain-containing protein n=1 Tax=Candidatus Curtissbacteria bacterium RIFCSPLOWO2_01_FULL_42_26 TaxID=1797729 RepID=A0A1F5HXE0_9BACT|nr:MAG: hypothetical protein A3A60_00670 [Candidatus Curtissbacteria bacterium RIFCSPLOWO2_01_FULL_42_26]